MSTLKPDKAEGPKGKSPIVVGYSGSSFVLLSLTSDYICPAAERNINYRKYDPSIFTSSTIFSPASNITARSPKLSPSVIKGIRSVTHPCYLYY